MRKLLPAACLFSMLLPQGLLLMGSEWGPGQFTVDGSSQPAQASNSTTKEGIPISIAPEKIIEILQKQPGLTYTIKKILADLALQQGRLLDENSFSDSTLFYLIQSDENIRAIVTTQLIKRKYIDVLPTDEEAEREYLRQRRMQAELSRAVRSNSVNEQADYSVSDPERRIGAEAEHQYARASESCSS